MGVQVAITVDDQLKPDYAVSTVLAANFLVETTECIVWFGNAFASLQHEQVSGIQRCLEFIRENGTETPLTTAQSYAEVAAPGLKKDVNGAFNAVAALPEEIKVGIWYGSAFQALPGSSISANVKRAVEKWLETTAKKE